MSGSSSLANLKIPLDANKILAPHFFAKNAFPLHLHMVGTKLTLDPEKPSRKMVKNGYSAQNGNCSKLFKV